MAGFQRVGLRVTGADFSQEIATLTTHIERLRHDIESLQGAVNKSSIDVIETEDDRRPLKSALKKSSRYGADGDSNPGNELTVPPPPIVPGSAGGRHRRNLSWCSSKTNGSASSSGTEYFSAVSSDDEVGGIFWNRKSWN